MVRRRTILVLLAVIGMALAGCVGSQGGADNASDPAADEVDNTSVAFEREDVPESAKTSGRHRHDPWGESEQKLIFDGTIEAGDCQDVFTPLVVVFDAVFRQEATYGCAWLFIENGTTVPPGTGKVEVDVDAEGARQEGGFQATTYTNDRVLRGQTVTEDQHTWWFELQEEDWDQPHDTRTGFAWYFEARGDVAVLDGSMEVTVRAHKITNWTPPLAAAHLDHWQLNRTHEFVNDNMTAIEVLDRTERVSSCSYVGFFDGSCQYQEPINLSDIVPPGTVQVVMAVEWSGPEDCAPEHDCDLSASVWSGNSSYTWNSPAEEGEGYRIFLYHVPGEIANDGTYANESKVEIHPYWNQCLRTETPSMTWCGLGNAAWAPEADVEFTMEAWRVPVDLEGFKERRGIGA